MIGWIKAIPQLISFADWVKNLINESRIRIDERVKLTRKTKDKTDADKKKGNDAIANLDDDKRNRLRERYGRTSDGE